MTPHDIFLFFAYEPCDEVTRQKLERTLKLNCPGDYRVVLRSDATGFDIDFDNEAAETLWLLTHGPIERT